MKNTLIPALFLLTLLSRCHAAEPLYAGKPLAFWLDGLKSDDPLIREEAILVLTDAGPAARAATPRLEAMLKDEQRGVRVRAALALWRIAGQTKPALAALTEALRDPAFPNRAEMLSKLGELGSEAAGNAAVVLPYVNDADGVVRMQAILVLRRFGAAAVPSILPALDDAEASVRRNAFYALAMLGPSAKEAVSKLSALLENADAEIRLEALKTLGKIGVEARSATPAILKLTKDKNAHFRATSLTTLENVDADPKIGRQAARDGLEDEDPLVRACAVLLLFHAAPKHPDVLPHVLELLKQPVGRTELLWLLTRMGPQAARAVPTLTKLLSEADPASRRLALQALQQIGPAARPAVPAMLDQLSAADFSIRQAAVNALRSIGGDSERIVPAVLEASKKDRTDLSICLPLLADHGAKAAAAVPRLVAELRRPMISYETVLMAETLHKIDPARARKEAVPILRKMLSPDGPWRVYAARALWSLQPDSDEALKTLIECVTGNNVSNRQQACLILGTLGKSARAAAPALRKNLNDAAMAKRVEAAVALWKISGETETTVPVLLEALQSSAGDFIYWRHRAAFALGEMGPALKTAALPALRKFRDDPDPAVRNSVLQAIQRIEGAAKQTNAP